KKPYRGRLAFYHPSAKGTGIAVRLELRLNETSDDRYDCFFLEMAKQKPTPSPETGKPQFDWENRATVKLEFPDLCEWLRVLEGQQPAAGGERGNGLFHQTGETTTLIEFRRDSDRPGVLLGLSRKARQGDGLFRGQLRLSEAEATGLRCCLQTGLFFLVYHTNLR
ncbi:MAG: hypothetical protein U1E27_04725, partial [Kiritimatiellia bacterium]|nr:hypothetical protein [Kiritimatiellia bacterium]